MNTSNDTEYGNNTKSSPTPFFPSVGLGLLKDFDPTNNRYTVPVVLESELLANGGNYITEFIPPKLVLNDGQTYDLVSKEIVMVYGVSEVGSAVVNASQDGTPVIPESRDFSAVSIQLRKSCLVSETDAGEKGLMGEIGKFPKFVLHLGTNNSPTNYRAVPDDLVNKYKLSKIGQFICPKDNAKGPYPLKFGQELTRGGYKENMALPPKLNRGNTMENIENMVGDTEMTWKIIGGVLGSILFVIIVWRLMARYGYL
jgi:hypothetical protein